MYLIIIIIPLIGSIISGILGRKLGVTGVQIITSVSIIISTFLSIIAYFEVGFSNSPVSIKIINWINSEILEISWSFHFDSLTVSILLPVLFVSSLVHIYSIDYMANDPHNQRFFTYLSLFTFFIVILVTGDNYLIIFVGWEGIGIASYLLINFWFTRIQANKSAIKALIINRVGDMTLSIAFFIMFISFGNLDFNTIFSLIPKINENIITFIGIILLISAMGKSAQLGLHGWLADSMEGPTPVSALIHAATLVTAGVYLLIRSSPIIEYSNITLIIILWIGSLTTFFAASTGIFQNDLKRIIAFSTCSQIGYLFISCGLSQYNLALFHLINHAFFKALLFLAAGSVLHACYDQQDLRKIGGFLYFIPFTYCCILIGNFSLIAIPWITGFYSKDLIIEIAYGQFEFNGILCYWIGSISAGITSFYSFRIITLTFQSYPNSSKPVYIKIHDINNIVIIPFIILSILAIFFGFLFKEAYIGIGTDFLSNSLFIHPIHNKIIEAENISMISKIIPIFLTMLFTIIAYYYYNSNSKILYYLKITNTKIYSFFNNRYYIDTLYNNYFIYYILNISYILSKYLDRGFIEIIGPYGLSNNLIINSCKISKLDSSSLINYIIFLIIGIIILFILCIILYYFNKISLILVLIFTLIILTLD